MNIERIQPWQGNLPCCHGPKDGCENHNPNKSPVFFDKTLPTVAKASGGEHKGDNVREPVVAEVWTSLIREPLTVDPLPVVHRAVPYSLAFYHVNAAMQQHLSGGKGSPDDGAALSALSCYGTHGSRPTVQWKVTPKITGSGAGAAFLVEYDMSFRISDPGDGVPTSGTSYSKNWFVSAGYKNFDLCPHMKRVFRSHRVEGRHGMRYAGVEFSLKNVLGQEFKDEWRSEVGRQPVNMCCGMCCTDTSMTFTSGAQFVYVRIVVYKDLGAGMSPLDPKWIAALRGTSIRRDKTDFGRMGAAFRGPPQAPPQMSGSPSNYSRPGAPGEKEKWVEKA